MRVYHPRMSQTKTKKSAKSAPSITVADVDLRTQAGRDIIRKPPIDSEKKGDG